MNPPKFYPGLALKAEHLIALEEYVLSRDFLVTPDHGVVGMQPPAWNNNFFQVSDVSGITPSGSPVKITGENKLLIEVPISSNTLVLDFYIENNHNRLNNDNTDIKLRLSYVNINRREHLPIKKDDSLYLGRYKLNRNDYERIEPPYFYNLNAALILFGKDVWEQWTKGIREELNELMTASPHNQLLNYKIAEFVFNYINWPVSTLTNKCRELAICAKYPDARDLSEENFMIELMNNHSVNDGNINNDTENESNTTPYEFLPDLLITHIKSIIGNKPDARFKFMHPDDFERTDDQIVIKRPLPGNNVIKIQFTEEIRAAFIKINGVDIATGVKEDMNEFGIKCWNYLINYDLGATKPLKAPWNIQVKGLKKDFSIYYQALTN